MTWSGKILSATLLAGMVTVGWAQAGPHLFESDVPPAPRGVPGPKVPAGSPSKPARNGAADSPRAKSSPDAPVGPTVSNSPFAPKGKRDPFASVIQIRTTGAACMAGRRCLVAAQVELKGVVKGPDGMLAVVENQQRKSYFLRENDPVFNGQVLRITPDSIVFREKVLDNLGHERTREVVKRVTGIPAV